MRCFGTFLLLCAGLSCTIGQQRRRNWQRVLASPDIPVTSFSCADRPMGYYADIETNCQAYHMCGAGGRQFSYLCPNTTLFHQRMLICAHWYQVNCSRSPEFYSANLLIGQRDKPFVDDSLFNGKQVYSLQDAEELQLLSSPGVSLREVSTERNLPRTLETQRVPPTGDLRFAPSGTVVPFRYNQWRTSKRVETSTEPQFPPTNVSFKSTIETPNLEPTQTVPMTSSLGMIRSRTEEPLTPQPTTRPSPTFQTTRPLLEPPSREFLPPFEEQDREESNTIELHFEDHRRSFYIPDSDNLEIPNEEIVISIPVKSESSRFKPTVYVKEVIPECKKCHPLFIIDRKNCSPCLLIK